MNERIRKLAEEAGFYFYDMHNVNGEDLGETIEADSWSAADKFAELIVRECARIARANPCPYEDEETLKIFGHTWDMASVEAGREIVKHFGIE